MLLTRFDLIVGHRMLGFLRSSEFAILKGPRHHDPVRQDPGLFLVSSFLLTLFLSSVRWSKHLIFAKYTRRKGRWRDSKVGTGPKSFARCSYSIRSKSFPTKVLTAKVWEVRCKCSRNGRNGNLHCKTENKKRVKLLKSGLLMKVLVQNGILSRTNYPPELSNQIQINQTSLRKWVRSHGRRSRTSSSVHLFLGSRRTLENFTEVIGKKCC